MSSLKWKIWVDTGGTFTDCIAINPRQKLIRMKVLSSGVLRTHGTVGHEGRLTVTLPFSCSDNFLNGFSIRMGRVIRTIVRFEGTTNEIALDKPFSSRFGETPLEIYTGEEVPVFAARLLTQTPLREDFPPIEMKLGSTRGTNALLERKGARTTFLTTRGFRDLIQIGSQQRPELFALNIGRKIPLYNHVLEVDERIESDGRVLVALNRAETDRICRELKKAGTESVAIAFINSYRNPSHEHIMAEAIRQAGLKFVSQSHALSSQIKILPRAETTIVNSYLEPIIDHYISSIQSGLSSADIKIMSSAGGLLPSSDFYPKDSLLSGPAGGVIGALAKAKVSGVDHILTFDMGGTSTDVSRCDGIPDYRFDCTVGDLKIFSPSLAIETIAAGGGSICSYDGYRLTVGPHSAGATPGPACYGAGGPVTVTDVNLLLGRLDAENFSIPIDAAHAKRALTKLIVKIYRKKKSRARREELLESFIAIANEKMAEAIRKISIRQGHDPRDYALLCFGGAGGQHACALAALLGVNHILVPYDAGLLSAYGIGMATREIVEEKLILKNLAAVFHELDGQFEALFEAAKSDLKKENISGVIRLKSARVFLRLRGQETSIDIEYKNKATLVKQFIARYKKVYGHWFGDLDIEVESIRVIATVAERKEANSTRKKGQPYSPVPDKFKEICLSGTWKKCPLFKWEKLSAGADIMGPALVISNNSTVLIEKGWSFQLDRHQNAVIRQVRVQRDTTQKSKEARLELFTNRFTAIAEEMGTLLQRASFSVNVKERLDFSCALLDANGNLVVNAPHIPVHLGSMGLCVRSVVRQMNMRDGDVVITNHPAFGGSHLPDITLIKPVFFKRRLVGFVANRAHHAEIGGKKPGSMPVDARSLAEEGVVISPTYLIRRGAPQWKKIENLLKSPPFPTRSLKENLADINGALASVKLGAEATQQLFAKFGADEVLGQMRLLRRYAADLTMKKLRTLSGVYEAQEFLDNGAALKVRLAKNKKKLIIDFGGSAAVQQGNLNATEAIVQSVVLYVMRLLVNKEIPLNEGLLEHISLQIPRGLLNPLFSKEDDKSPAVVGGNTEVSQRLADTLLKALKMAACSQGTMNNLLFGNEQFGYYETICGGVGAGPGFNGADAVHQHMTNTRITDPEILEFRYPVRLERFEIRKGSGGAGKWHGGSGIIRQFYFKAKLDVNILSQHRIVAPYGMHGGQPGKKGEQFLLDSNNKKTKLDGVDGVQVYPGDRLVIMTPGGGGWGRSFKRNSHR